MLQRFLLLFSCLLVLGFSPPTLVAPKNNKLLRLQWNQAYQQLQNQLITYNQYFTNEKLQLKVRVCFSELRHHTLSELLYISFMEPSAERLRLEWNLPIETVKVKLSGLPTHVHPEFPFLGNLYDRNAVEALAPFRGLPVSGNVREVSEIEVNHLK